MSRQSAQVRDQEARELAQTEFTSPVIVEAGAGTGKTTILVSRVLSWALGLGWREVVSESGDELSEESIAAKVLEGVVAITFTEAAAAEMAARVAERLAQIATGVIATPGFEPDLMDGKPEPAELSRRARALLGQLDRLTACTIHAFCHALLRRHPFEAGLHPDFSIDARGDRLEEIVRTVVEDRIKRAYADDNPSDSPLLELAAYGKSPQAVAEALSTFAFEGWTAAGLRADPFHQDQIGPIAKVLSARLDRFLELAAGDLSKIKRTVNPQRVQEAIELSAAILHKASDDRLEGLRLAEVLSASLRAVWEPKAWAHLKKWGRGTFGKGETETLGDRVTEIAELANELRRRLSYLYKTQPTFLDTARRALLPLLERVETEARANGIVTFQALLYETWRLLHEHRRIRRYERKRIRQLLVDEFQDTDRLQCDIVELLALPRVPSSDDRAQSQLGLFIVGDPKQSIYGWRNADLASYERLVSVAREAGGSRYSLVRNFRSRTEILDEVERAIAPVMVEEPALQPPFEALISSVDESTADEAGVSSARSPVEYWLSWHPEQGGRTKQIEAAEIEARAIAEDIRDLHATGTDWKDCALLLRNASRIDTYLDGFRDAGVPFVVTSDKQYFRRREVIDAAAMVRAVVSPADHTALLTWLRSAVVGVPDAALIPLWTRGFPGLMTELDGDREDLLDEIASVVRAAAAATPRDIPGLEALDGWDDLLLQAIGTLASLRKSLRQEPVDRFLEHMRWSFATEAIEGARYLGRYRVANLERLFRSIESGLEDHAGDFRAVLRLLRRSVEKAVEAEEALPKDAAADAVQVMTIHKAKGLEFGHVYLAQLHAEGRTSERSTFDADRRWDGTNQMEYVLFNVPTLGFEDVEQHRERVSAAEQVRTLYVAMTRARERLVLVGNWPDPPKKGRSPQPTYVDLLRQRPGLPASMTERAETAGTFPEGVIDSDGIRWKFPGLCSVEDHHGNPAEAPNLASPETILEASERLEAHRADAAIRMSRPFFASASLGDDHPEFEIEASGPDVDLVPLDRATAMTVGKAVHQVLEAWDFTALLETEFKVRSRQTRDLLEQRLSGKNFHAAWEIVQELLDRFRKGPIMARLTESPDRVIARELPVLLPADPRGLEGPIAGTNGVVDLILQTEDSSWTVVDYKTDRVETEEELHKRAAAYGPQLDVYSRALTDALGLDQAPNKELWFLWSDHMWTLI